MQCRGQTSIPKTFSHDLGHNRALLEGRFGAGQFVCAAKLLNRVFDLKFERCPNSCHVEIKFIAAILARLGLDPESPPKGPAGDSGPQLTF
jgi:hypothetical protein